MGSVLFCCRMFICSFRFLLSGPPSTLPPCGLQRSCALASPWILPAPPFAFTLSRLRQFLCFGPGPPAFPPTFHPLSPSRLPFPFWPGRSAVLLPDFLHNFAAWLALSSFCWLLLLAAPSFRTYFSPLSSCLCYPMCYWHCCWRHSVNSLWPFQLVIHLKPHTMTKCSICFAHLRLLLHLPSPNHI